MSGVEEPSSEIGKRVVSLKLDLTEAASVCAVCLDIDASFWIPLVALRASCTAAKTFGAFLQVLIHTSVTHGLGDDVVGDVLFPTAPRMGTILALTAGHTRGIRLALVAGVRGVSTRALGHRVLGRFEIEEDHQRRFVFGLLGLQIA